MEDQNLVLNQPLLEKPKIQASKNKVIKFKEQHQTYYYDTNIYSIPTT